MMKRIIIGTTMLLGLILITGCFNGIKIPLGDGNSIQLKTGDEGISVNVSGEDGGTMGLATDDGVLTLTDGDGTVSFYQDIPEHFPAYLPVPDNIEPAANFVTIGEMNDGSEVYAIVYYADVEREEEIMEMYENYLSNNNFEVHERVDGYGQYITAENQEAIFNVGVAIHDTNMMVTFHYTVKGEQE